MPGINTMSAYSSSGEAVTICGTCLLDAQTHNRHWHSSRMLYSLRWQGPAEGTLVQLMAGKLIVMDRVLHLYCGSHVVRVNSSTIINVQQRRGNYIEKGSVKPGLEDIR